MAAWDSTGRHIDGDAGLIAAFANFGEYGNIPTLWLYARNDSFFNPLLQAALYEAYTRRGGRATYIPFDSFEANGHFMVYRQSAVPIWMPHVDNYLKSIGLGDHVKTF